MTTSDHQTNVSNSGHASPGPSNVVIDSDGATLSITPRELETAIDVHTRRLRPAVDDDGAGGVAGESQSLLWPDVRRRNAGLLHVAIVAAQRDGFTVQARRTSLRTEALPPAAIEENGYLRLIDLELIQALREQPEVLVRYAPDAVDPARLIAQMVHAYPHATIAILCASCDAVHHHARLLRYWGIDAHVFRSGDAIECADRVVVTLFLDSADPAIDLEKRDIVIVPRALDAISEMGQLPMSTMDARFRVVGFISTDERLSPSERDWLVGTYGLNDVTIPRHGHRHIPIDVAATRIDVPAVAPRVSGLRLRNLGYERHYARNRRIGRLAAAIANQEHDWLARNVPRVGEWLEARQLAYPPRVAVVAHTVDHVVTLAKRLPDWTVITDGDVAIEPTLQRLQDHPHTWAMLGWMVATTSALDHVDVAALDVIVWASGGVHLPPLPRDRLICPAGDPRRLLVVDVDDRHHPLLRRWSHSRGIAYLDAGWCPVGADAQWVRVDSFLRCRPRSHE